MSDGKRRLMACYYFALAVGMALLVAVPLAEPIGWTPPTIIWRSIFGAGIFMFGFAAGLGLSRVFADNGIAK